VPVKIQITETERRLHDTNARWHSLPPAAGR
jgi:hypothetical protein